MTPNREDYLKVIFKLNDTEKIATNKMIAEHLKIAPASVSEMIKKLQKSNLVIVENNIISLSEEGYNKTIAVLSKHRLWETFLLRYLNYTWQDVHEQAELLEHVTNERLMESLNKFLDYPTHCPHGSLIYENISVEKDTTLTLKKLGVSQKAKIVKVRSDKSLLSYLDRYNLNIGSELEVISKDEFDNSISIKYKENIISISFKAIDMIYVELV